MCGKRLRPHCSQAATAIAANAWPCAPPGRRPASRRCAGQDGNDARSRARSPSAREIHALAARDTLGKRDRQRRLALDGTGLAHRRVTRGPRALSTVAANSRPSPVNSTSGSPLRTRMTFARCSAAARGGSRTAPGLNARSI